MNAIEIEINQNCTVEKLAQKINEIDGIPVDEIYLSYKSKWIFPDFKDSKLVDLGIQTGVLIEHQLRCYYNNRCNLNDDIDIGINNIQADSVIENKSSGHTWLYKRKLVAAIGILSSAVTLVLFVLLLLSILETNLVLLIFFTVFSIIFDVWFISWNCICFKCNGKQDSGVVEENKEYKNEEIIRPQSKDDDINPKKIKDNIAL